MQTGDSLLDTIVNNLPTGAMVIRGSDLRILMVNEPYKAIAFGKEMVGRTLAEVWPEREPLFSDQCRQVLDTGVPHHSVDEPLHIRRSPDGHFESRTFKQSLVRIRLPGDEGWGILNTVIETTEKKQVVESLRASEERIRVITNNLVSCMIYQVVRLKDGSRKFTYLSDAVTRLYGISPQAGMENADLIYGRIHPDDRMRVWQEEESAAKVFSIFKTGCDRI